MKRLFIFSLVLSIIFTFASNGYSAQYWAKSYWSKNKRDYMWFMQQTFDTLGNPNGYIILSTSSTGPDNLCWILKLDNYGNISWEKSYQIDDYYGPANIQQTDDDGDGMKDDGYIVAGRFHYPSWNTIWVLKLDANGDIAWQKKYSGGVVQFDTSSIQQTSDGGFIVLSWLDYTVSVLKLYSDGNISWHKTYGGSYDENSISSIQQTSEGGYIATFGASTPPDDYNDAIILKLDSNGNISWQKIYKKDYDDNFESIQQTDDDGDGVRDDGYIVTGFTNANRGSIYDLTSDIWVLKLDSGGNISWKKTYDESKLDGTHSIQQTFDVLGYPSGYLVAGGTGDINLGNCIGNTWLMKLDSNGDISWQKRYGSEYPLTGSGGVYAQQTTDGGIIVGGDEADGGTICNGTGIIRKFVLKLDGNGDIPNCNIISSGNATVSSPSIIIEDYDANVQIASINVDVITFISHDTSAEITSICWCDDDDFDCDGIPNDGGDHHCTSGEVEDCDDNCPNQPNGTLGTCVKTEYGVTHSYKVGSPKQFITCDSNEDCTDTDGFCRNDQGDFNGNGIGDVCECYYDINKDGKVSTPDFSVLRWEYGRINCPSSGGNYDDFILCQAQPLNQTSCEATSGCVWNVRKGRCYTPSCLGDVNKDGRVSTPDFCIERIEYGRLDCP